ncbi:M24 family metallopeptidase [Salinicoccus halitifaciens]|uniref:Xaa-Pro aminopeptidase n=1 Tax=Salinicoccus halitifaciens TaxID=1073415 RepID=A0ABV2E8Q7_9STAP|nr:Xaa-Pro peptidase family protein [Salinicoccus halitifaciens]MCD2137928.1 Xaa-Pro peptidase family protein [Salinicoccus halitifaciens]
MFDFKSRRSRVIDKLQEQGDAVAIVMDPNYVYYLTGYHAALGIDWGRPNIFIQTVDGESVLIVPSMEEEMAERQTDVATVIPWTDGTDGEWRPPLKKYLEKYKNDKVAVDYMSFPRIVWDYIGEVIPKDRISDIGQEIDRLRSVKDPQEIQIARHAGEVAVEMLKGAMKVAAPGVYEYEVELASKQAGTRHAAKLMEEHYQEADPFNYPGIGNKLIMGSGHDITMTHHRSSMTKLEHGEPLFICHCGTAEFKNFFVGFDRTLFVGDINKEVEKMLDIAEEAQKAALSEIKPGAYAKDVFKAYADVIEDNGYPVPFRAGRSLGFSYTAYPELAKDSEAVLEEGMVFAVDGGTDSEDYRTQVGDSILVTEDGFEYLTPFTKDHNDLIVGK